MGTCIGYSIVQVFAKWLVGWGTARYSLVGSAANINCRPYRTAWHEKRDTHRSPAALDSPLDDKHHIVDTGLVPITT